AIPLRRPRRGARPHRRRLDRAGPGLPRGQPDDRRAGLGDHRPARGRARGRAGGGGRAPYV
ncbi:MAG: hypothetical protein AVDCRST_MAG32-659, partial [uncultured Nocardioides sp.]